MGARTGVGSWERNEGTASKPLRCGYQRREPEKTVLHQVVREELETLLGGLAAEGHRLPRYVEQELRRYLPCGLISEGFARVACRGCGEEILVAFHPPISLERLRYHAETGQVIYYGRQRDRCGDAGASPARIFSALDFLAALCLHVPDCGQQLVRYYGAFSNVRRVSAGASASASAAPAGGQAVHQDDSAEEFARGRRRSWARLIKKVYEADPLVCPRCSGPLKILSLIGDAAVIENILRHLKLWDRPERPPPPAAVRSIHYDEPTVDPDEADQWPDATA